MTRRRWLISLLSYLIVTMAVLCAAPFFGSESLSAKVIINDFGIDSANWNAETRILVYQRLPRVILGFLVGGSLALVGSVFQVILRNPLAAPSTLGVTGGGAVGAVLAISIPQLIINIGPFSSIPLFALLGASLSLGFIYLLARRPDGISMNTLLLAGVTVGIMCGAVNLLIRYLAHPNTLVAMDRWLMGGLDVIGFRETVGLLPLLLPGAIIMMRQTGSLNHLALGEEMALGQGVDVAAVQRASFLAGSLVTAAAVSFTGPIFFVGLIVPHAVRYISGYDHRIVLPASFLAGGGFLVLCDIIARTVIAPTEMPVGIITAILGGPFFIYLLLRKK